MKRIATCGLVLIGLGVALVFEFGSRVHSQTEPTISNNINYPRSNRAFNAKWTPSTNAAPTQNIPLDSEWTEPSPLLFVGVEKGNIWFIDPSARKVLTVDGSDASPFLSLDHERIVFVRTLKADANSQKRLRILFIVGSDGRNLTKLAEGEAFWDPQFSPDGKTVYFRSPGWATSTEVNAIDIATKKVRLVCPGNTLDVIQTGKHAGKLIVQQHKYFLGIGTYDFYWLINPDGKEEGVIGDSEEQVKTFKSFGLNEH